MALVAGAIEVGDFTLLRCGDELGLERDADALPTLLVATLHGDIVVGRALVPHAMTTIKLVGYRAVEVLLIHEEVVAVSNVLTSLAEDHMTLDELLLGSRHSGNTTIPSLIGIGAAVVAKLLTEEVTEVIVEHIVGGLVRGLRRTVDQQVLRQVDIAEASETGFVEQWRIEVLAFLQTLLITLRHIVVAREVDSGHTLMSQYGSIALLGLCEDGVWVEVSHLHCTVAIVGRCAVDAVAISIGLEAAIALINARRELLMLRAFDMTIGQLLSEEDVIIRPDRHIVGGGHGIVALTLRDGSHVDIGALRRGATSIAVITVVEAVLHIAEVWQ